MNLEEKEEYNIGDVVDFERQISLKPHTINTYNYTGIIVKKSKKSAIDRTVYWFQKGEYDYLISIPEFGGDYIWTCHDDINGVKNISIEYKLSFICYKVRTDIVNLSFKITTVNNFYFRR